jgi:dTDP-glucose 4,6-dehydratase
LEPELSVICLQNPSALANVPMIGRGVQKRCSKWVRKSAAGIISTSISGTEHSMTILVTGGAGFIGSNFVLDWLAKSDETVVNLDKLSYAGNLQNLSSLEKDSRHVFVKGDIGDATLVAELLVRHQPRAIVNFAAESHVDRSIHGPGEFVQNNIVGTYQLLESVRSYWSPLPAPAKSNFRFLHVSTDEVFGSLDKSAPAFTERHAMSPTAPTRQQAASDHLVRAWHHTYGLPVLTTTAPTTTGPITFPRN